MEFCLLTMQMMHTYLCGEGDIASKIVLVFLATNVVVDRPYIIMGTVRLTGYAKQKMMAIPIPHGKQKI